MTYIAAAAAAAVAETWQQQSLSASTWGSGRLCICLVAGCICLFGDICYICCLTTTIAPFPPPLFLQLLCRVAPCWRDLIQIFPLFFFVKCAFISEDIYLDT